jgi:hypothetical protein
MAAIIYRMIGDWPDYGNGDLSALRVKSLDPKDGESNVDPDTSELVATFNMDIAAVDDLDAVEAGIEVRDVTDGDDVAIDSVSISGSKLTIDLGESLDDDMKYRVTIDKGIIESDDSDYTFDGISGSEWEFYTYAADEELISLSSLDPEDGDDNVNPDTSELRATFDSNISVISGKSLLSAVRVYNASHSRNVAVQDVEIDGDTLIITLEDNLGSGDTFEVTIKSGYLEDDNSGENYGGLSGAEWRFTTD